MATGPGYLEEQRDNLTYACSGLQDSQGHSERQNLLEVYASASWSLET